MQNNNPNIVSAKCYFTLTRIDCFAKYNQLESVDLFFNKGLTLANRGLNEEAIEYYKKALEIDENHIASLYNLCYSYSRLELNQQALAVIDRINIIDPDWWSFQTRATINRALGNIEEAKLDEEKAWEIGHYFNAF